MWNKMNAEELFNDFYKSSTMNTQPKEAWDPDKYSDDRSNRNGSGYYDPTCYKATRDITGSHRRYSVTR